MLLLTYAVARSDGGGFGQSRLSMWRQIGFDARGFGGIGFRNPRDPIVGYGRTAMPNGTVKWFDSKKGFGFILSPEGKDVFVHFSSIAGDGFRSLKDGEPVEYEQLQGEKGLLAKNVRRLNPATP